MSSQAGEKKHPPTPEKLRKLRDEGQWYSSNELVAAAITAMFALMWSGGRKAIAHRLVEVARFAWSPERLASPDPLHTVEAAARQALGTLAVLVGSFLLALTVVSVLLKFLQIGPLFTVKPLLKPSRLNPFQGFQQIFFKGQTYQRAAINLVKAGVMTALVGIFCWQAAPELLASSRVGIEATLTVFSSRFTGFLWQAAVLYALFGGADYLVQRTNFMKEQRMTDEELKEDQKNTQGNPEAKMRMRSLQIQAVQEAMAKEAQARAQAKQGGGLKL